MDKLKGHGGGSEKDLAEKQALFEKARDPTFEELENEEEETVQFQQLVLKEVHRREAAYGKKGEEKEKERDSMGFNYMRETLDNGSDEESKEPKVKDIFQLGLPKYPKMSAEDKEKERKIIAENQPKYRAQVEKSIRQQNLNQVLLNDITQKMTKQLEGYKENIRNFPKDPQGLYILLDGQFTVKNKYNDNNPTSGKPVDLY